MAFKERELHINGFEETEHRQSIGVSLYIMGPGRTIWSTLEVDNNFVMDKNGGQLSIPAERRKINESLWGNIYGALGEFCSDRDLPLLSSRLFIVGKPELTSVTLNNNKLLCTLVPMACYVDIKPTPFNISEVLPNGWKRPEDMLLCKNLRPLARQLLEVGGKRSLWKKGDDGLKEPANRISVFGTNSFVKNLDEFLKTRDSQFDIVGVNGNSYVNGNNHNGLSKSF